MQVLPVDLVALVSVILGISVVLVPVIGLTARFALKPVVEALGRVFESRTSDESMRILERRVGLQEQQIEALQETLKHMSDAQDFDRLLARPRTDDPTASR
jgi:hypothetical protein